MVRCCIDVRGRHKESGPRSAGVEGERATRDKDPLDPETEWVKDIAGLQGVGSFDVPVNEEC